MGSETLWRIEPHHIPVLSPLVSGVLDFCSYCHLPSAPEGSGRLSHSILHPT